MLSRILLTGCLFFLLGSLQAQEVLPDMKEIFNGKNLEGWVVPENNRWWSVKDGMLTAASTPDKQGSILWTTDAYEDFVFQADFKMGKGTVDSGIFLRDENVQIQIGISGSLQRDMTVSPYIPGKGYPLEAQNIQEVLLPADWNTLRIEARDNTFTVWLNDRNVMQYTADSAAERGPLGLQLHPGNEMQISFRNIKVAKR